MTSILDKPKEYIPCEWCKDLVWKMTTVIKNSGHPEKVVEFWCPKCWEKFSKYAITDFGY